MGPADFIQLSYLQKYCTGIIFKRTPGCLRILVCIQMLLLFYVLWAVFIAHTVAEYTSNWERDCYASFRARIGAVFCSAFWLAQVFLGRLATKLTRKPDWLYTPRPPQPNPVRKFLMKFFH